MTAVYGIDLRHACYGTDRIGGRRLLALVRGLGPRSALGRAHNQGQDWSTMEDLLSLLAELVDQGNRMFFAANRGKNADRIPEPIQISRPGVETEVKPQATSDDVKQFFKGR